MGASMIELDVYQCKSGQIVVIHDPTIDRTTNGSGAVADMTFEQLQTYDAGKGEHIPLLSQVFDLVNKQIPLMIELKDGSAVKPVADLIEQYVRDKKWSYDSFIVTSFDHYAIKGLKKMNPHIKTGVIFEGIPIGLAQIATRAGAQYAILYYDSVTPAFIKDAHKRGVKLFSYTVNSKPLAQKLIAQGIDGIITNYPDILSKT
jgi:glycerophosphoryl diester phosphodiesterase